ncbi:hypothetical protein M422DRAFT_59634 [Sphaerobolus stellatus SS14]|uniref:Unplaced genomic scaffold SPHSTscaffold_33, whole genome shotgun sequence n=1 Tax=Sphaerobolus stellatus (strain SS14) TaxID=990650 RepID=A0A0C9W3A3_SPHS4|nr:hypothetical protein M422DRAFT_59634 [Sphaerobolus stellatus SS14]
MQTQRVYGGRGVKHQYRQGNANHENTTVLITICADGTSTRPVVIFKGENVMNSWFKNNIANCMITRSRNGWTEQEIAEDWIIKFVEETAEKAAGEPRALFLDGHNSHYSPKLLRYAQAHNIIIFGYPPHCTHALQDLDVVDLVKAAFSATGIVPFNPNVISTKKMKLSKRTSVKGTFPLVQPSPVRAVVNHLMLFRLTQFDRDPEHARGPIAQLAMIPEQPVSDPGVISASPLPHSKYLSHQRSTPTRSINKPRQFTPSNIVRILISQLSSTSTGSFLVSEPLLKSTIPVQPPILEPLPSLPTSNISAGNISLNTAEYMKEQLAEIILELAQQLTSAQAHLLARDGTIT